jgi:hypothetical protein
MGFPGPARVMPGGSPSSRTRTAVAVSCVSSEESSGGAGGVRDPMRSTRKPRITKSAQPGRIPRFRRERGSGGGSKDVQDIIMDYFISYLFPIREVVAEPPAL